MESSDLRGLRKNALCRRSFLALLLGSLVASSSGANVRELYVYGDSYLDDGEIQASLDAIGIGSAQVFTAAVPGATSFDWSVDPDERRCVASNDYAPEDCTDGVHQMRPVEGWCRHRQDSDDDGFAESTCLEDRPLGRADHCLILFGINDVGRGNAAAWLSAAFPEVAQAFDAMLAEADAFGVTCVVAAAFPPIEAGFYPEREQNLRKLRNFQRDKLMELHPRHVFVDTVQIIDDYRAMHGESAANGLYGDCQMVGGEPVPGPTGCIDGIHPGYFPNSLGVTGRQVLGDAIAAGLLELVEARQVPVGPALPLAAALLAAGRLAIRRRSRRARAIGRGSSQR